jgi:hypothetical protein
MEVGGLDADEKEQILNLIFEHAAKATLRLYCEFGFRKSSSVFRRIGTAVRHERRYSVPLLTATACCPFGILSVPACFATRVLGS